MRRYAATIAAASITLFVAFAWRAHQLSSPEYAIQQVLSINSVADVDTHKKYLTDQGKKILTCLLSIPTSATTSPAPIIGPPEVAGDTCRFQFSQTGTEGEYVFRRHGVWQLDDIIWTRCEGHAFNVSFSKAAEPMRALAVISALKTREEMVAHTQYLTAKGKKVMLYLYGKKGSSNDSNVVLLDPIISDGIAKFPFADPDVAGYMLLIKDGDWKVDDAVFTRMNNRSMDIAVSYLIDHPIISFFKMFDIEAFFKGFAMGWGAIQ